MNIPDWLQQRLVWRKPKKDEEGAYPVLEKVLQDSPCESCGKLCKTLRVEHIRKNKIPVPHWRRHCNICKLYLNPTTNQYDLTAQKVSNFYNENYKDK